MINTASFTGTFAGLNYAKEPNGMPKRNANGSLTVFALVSGKVGVSKDPNTGMSRPVFTTNSFKSYIPAEKIRQTAEGLDIGFLGSVEVGQPVCVSYTPRNERFVDKNGEIHYDSYLRLESLDALEDKETASLLNPTRQQIMKDRLEKSRQQQTAGTAQPYAAPNAAPVQQSVQPMENPQMNPAQPSALSASSNAGIAYSTQNYGMPNPGSVHQPIQPIADPQIRPVHPSAAAMMPSENIQQAPASGFVPQPSEAGYAPFLNDPNLPF